ncbi:MAG: hypothetical protein M1814_003683 [Vezdaea aestivalis]|nr:MAG: hypothetical protein M1814_003683 [Vezdaea aestivalis]
MRRPKAKIFQPKEPRNLDDSHQVVDLSKASNDYDDNHKDKSAERIRTGMGRARHIHHAPRSGSMYFKGVHSLGETPSNKQVGTSPPSYKDFVFNETMPGAINNPTTRKGTESETSVVAKLPLTYNGIGQRTKTAGALESQELERRKEVLGERHPATLPSMANLASIYCNLGRYTKAEALQIQVLEMRKEIFGERHPDTLTSMRDLASLYFYSGQYTEAEALEIQGLGIRKEVLGERHPDTLTSVSKLAKFQRVRAQVEPKKSSGSSSIPRRQPISPNHISLVGCRTFRLQGSQEAKLNGHAQERVVIDGGKRNLPVNTLDLDPVNHTLISEYLIRAAISGNLALTQRLLFNQASLSVYGDPKSSALLWAAYKGHVGVAKLLLEHGTDPSATYLPGWTPLHHAAMKGHKAIAELLLIKGAGVSPRDPDGWTPLHHAANKGHEAVADLLLNQGAGVSPRDLDGWTPLHHAAMKGHEAVADILLNQGAAVSPRDPDGWTPLHHAANKGHEAVADLLLNQGANVLHQDSNGWTALHHAVKCNDKAVAKLLLDCGAKILEGNHGGVTCLHMAASYGYRALVELFLDRGAYSSVQQPDGQTALHRAASMGHETVTSLLLDRGADVTVRTFNEGWTPLHCAAEKGHTTIAKLLLEKGAGIAAADAQNETALDSTFSIDYKHTAILFIESSVNLASQSEVGDKVLRMTMRKGLNTVTQLLLEEGLDNETNDDGEKSALHTAVRIDDTEAVNLPSMKGPEIEVEDGKRNPALPIANSGDLVGSILVLFEEGAEIEFKNSEGHTALHTALLRGWSGTKKAPRKKRNEVIAACDNKGTILYDADTAGCTQSLKLLVVEGANIPAEDDSRSTAIHQLALYGGHNHNRKIVAWLRLSGEINIEAKDTKGRTALSLAAGRGNEAIVKLLLEKSASTTVPDIGGRTALDWAISKGHPAVANLLERILTIETAREVTISRALPRFETIRNWGLSISKRGLDSYHRRELEGIPKADRKSDRSLSAATIATSPKESLVRLEEKRLIDLPVVTSSINILSELSEVSGHTWDPTGARRTIFGLALGTASALVVYFGYFRTLQSTDGRETKIDSVIFSIYTFVAVFELTVFLPIIIVVFQSFSRMKTVFAKMLRTVMPHLVSIWTLFWPFLGPFEATKTSVNEYIITFRLMGYEFSLRGDMERRAGWSNLGELVLAWYWSRIFRRPPRRISAKLWRVFWVCECGKAVSDNFAVANEAAICKIDTFLNTSEVEADQQDANAQVQADSTQPNPPPLPSRPALAHFPAGSPLPSSGEESSDSQTTLSPISSTSSQSTASDHRRFLELCVKVSRFDSRLLEVNLSTVYTNQRLFEDINKAYYGLRRIEPNWVFYLLDKLITCCFKLFCRNPYRGLLFLEPIRIEFVKMQLDLPNNADPYEKPRPDIPPAEEILSNRYHTIVRDLERDGCPIPSDRFMHCFYDPSNHTGRRWIDRLPKKLGDSLKDIRTPGVDHAWGIFIHDGPNWFVIIPCVLFGLVCSLLVAVLYALCKKDVQGGWTLGSWVVGCEAVWLTVMFSRYAQERMHSF